MEQERFRYTSIIDLDSVPPGYRFKPRDDELILHYLKPKLYNQPFQPNIIKEVQLYNYDPDTLIEEYPTKNTRVSEWYFFTPRDRKYRNGNRPNRAAGDGFWKATGADKPVMSGQVIVGKKKTLVFYKGKPPKGDKTEWIMHEFVLEGSPPRERASHDMRLNDWVLCRIYNKKIDNKYDTLKDEIEKVDKEEEHSIPNAIPASVPDTASQTEIEMQECGREDNNNMPLGEIATPTSILGAPFSMVAQEIPPYHYDWSAMLSQPPTFVEPIAMLSQQQDVSLPPFPSSYLTELDNRNMGQYQPNEQFNQFAMEDMYLLNTDFGV